ncbi:hypothetical protein [Sediminibacillus halophilus]|uniref:Uncharacterized protein n=1 Tax=Sediminibacillus halophilus TaxID=482461 RepID=A0A1G9R436_9BACI|nr:hypothetical protein [Sediminibacillus halophilus]SDM18029.1 hypothetical protein SAMN05216244_1809 [Sediminibacillus halophilus]
MKEKLFIIFNDWKSKLEKDEWYFRNSYEDLINRLTSQEAFDNIPDVISVLLTIKNSFLIGETIDFLHELYNIADTTEIHPYLQENLMIINKHIEKYADTYGKDAFGEFKSSIRL